VTISEEANNRKFNGVPFAFENESDVVHDGSKHAGE
jgi:hypothetical protein